MQQLIDSMVRFSTAITLFGLQQVQNAVDLASDSQGARKKIEDSLDRVTAALTEQLDESKRPAVSSVANLVDKAQDALDVPVLNVKKMVNNATDAVRETTDTMADAISKSSPNKKKKKHSDGEPVLASTILTADA
jgi:hypothetical protein